MNGRFGVFCDQQLVDGLEFFEDEDADTYRRELLQEHLPEHMRSPLYDPHQLEVREIEDSEPVYQAADAVGALLVPEKSGHAAV